MYLTAKFLKEARYSTSLPFNDDECVLVFIMNKWKKKKQ